MGEIIKLLKNSTFADLLAKSVEKEDQIFKFAHAEFLADDSYFTLYVSQSEAILLEIQPHVTKISMKQSVEKCLDVYDRFGIEPLLVILTGKISSSVTSSLKTYHHRKILDNIVWAKKCFVIPKDAISLTDNEANRHIDPLVVLALYFSDDEEQKQKLQNGGDPTMQLIHTFF